MSDCRRLAKTSTDGMSHLPSSLVSSTKMTLPIAYSTADLQRLDAEDKLNWTRSEFEIPSARACGADQGMSFLSPPSHSRYRKVNNNADGEAIYFCGNSLGLLSKRARQHLLEELDVWSSSSVTGHFRHPHQRPWKHVDRPLTPLLAEIVGAKEEEVAHTSTLTSNMHNLFASFYRPTQTRWKIVIEKGSFPSDWVSFSRSREEGVVRLIQQYAVHSHPKLHENTLSPEQIENAIIPLSPREGEETLRTEDILRVLEENSSTVCGLSFSCN